MDILGLVKNMKNRININKIFFHKFNIVSLFAFVLCHYNLISFYTKENAYNEENVTRKKEEFASAKKEKIIFDESGETTSDSNLLELISNAKANSERINLSIVFKDSFEPRTSKPSMNSSLEEINNAVKLRREEVRKHFSINNRLKLIDLDIDNYDEVYISRYSPFVDISFDLKEMSKDEYESLLKIPDNNIVDSVYIKTSNCESTEEMESAFPAVKLPTPEHIPSCDYNGEGIVIGVLESGGIVDVTNPNISGSNTIVRDEWYYSETISSHALRVASIIGANTGIARKANILSVELSGDPKSEVEWMLDRNVNIINNSWSEANQTKSGDYKSNSAYFDYISRLNWVTVCSSAGNIGKENGWVGNPGLGYNVITVGASHDGTLLADFSSYKENFGISKPTLVAPGYDISVPTLPDYEEVGEKTLLVNCGTSFSTPIVTGTIALLMQEFPTLKAFPELVIAMLTVSTSKMSSIYNNFDSSGLEDKVGAGKLNYENSRKVFKNKTTFNNSSKDKGVKASKSIYLNKGDTVRISLAWLVDSNNETNPNIVTDYDLKLCDSNNSSVMVSVSAKNNIELIEYTATTSGSYTINAVQYGDKKSDKTDYGAMCYYITNK